MGASAITGMAGAVRRTPTKMPLDADTVCSKFVPVALSAELSARHDADCPNDQNETHFWCIEQSGLISYVRSFWCISTRSTVFHAAVIGLHLHFDNGQTDVYLPHTTNVAALHRRFVLAAAEHTLFLGGLHPTAQPVAGRIYLLSSFVDEAKRVAFLAKEQRFLGTIAFSVKQ